MNAFWMKFFETWASPAGVTFIVTMFAGAIIWGIQLNWADKQHTEAMGSLTTIVNENRKAIREDGVRMERIVALLDQLEKRMSHAEDDIEAHEKESATWKYKINRNEQRLESLRDQGTR